MNKIKQYLGWGELEGFKNPNLLLWYLNIFGGILIINSVAHALAGKGNAPIFTVGFNTLLLIVFSWIYSKKPQICSELRLIVSILAQGNLLMIFVGILLGVTQTPFHISFFNLFGLILIMCRSVFLLLKLLYNQDK